MHIVIIGNGVSGVTCARFIRKHSNHKITIVSNEHEYFFSRTALMYVYMGHMKFIHTEPYERWFWEKNKIELTFATVKNIDVTANKIITDTSQEISYDQLVIATGSTPRALDFKGNDLNGIQGLYHKQDLEKLESRSNQISHGVILGGGLIGVELAEMLHSRGIHVTMLVRENSYWRSVLPHDESEIVTSHLIKQGIKLEFNEGLTSAEGDINTNNIKQVTTSNGKQINCDFLGITIGVTPNIDFIKNSEIAYQQGVLVNEFFETNIKNIYAIGDCAEFKNPVEKAPAIEQLWYTGKMHGERLGINIGKGLKEKYNRGIWFNSAKFFDIEYQTYGYVPAKDHEHYDSFVWKNIEKEKCIRIVFEKDSKKVVGFNFIGIRYQQPVAEAFISKELKINEVIDQIEMGNFDPEFSKNYFKELKQKFRANNETILI